MYIHVKDGDKVRPLFKNGKIQHGSNYDKKIATTHLKEGQEYTIYYTIVYNFHTEVHLKEIPGVKFNSVHFENTI